jgi:hypothetical protein
MGFYNADDLPVYDHLASEYCVVDRWFSSVPGATWPNRLYSIAGASTFGRDIPLTEYYRDEMSIHHCAARPGCGRRVPRGCRAGSLRLARPRRRQVMPVD